MSTTTYHAAVFDLDGTLLDTLDELGICCNAVLEKNGYPTHPLDRYKAFVGEGAEMLLRNALGKNSDDDPLVQRCLDEFLDLYHRTCGQYASLYPGIRKLLEALISRNIRLAVLSNKPHDLTLININLFLKDIPFAPVFGQRKGIAKKPDPQGAMDILAHLKIPAHACLYLGDTAIDMKTATAAGMYPVGVLWGFRSKDELVQHGAKTVIETPLDLLDLL